VLLVREVAVCDGITRSVMAREEVWWTDAERTCLVYILLSDHGVKLQKIVCGNEKRKKVDWP
jgi:hypothetical protein